MVISRYSNAALVKRFRSKPDFIVPIDSERIKCVVAEIIHILKFATDAFLHQWSEINQLYGSIVESEFQNVVANIFGRSYFQKKHIIHGRLSEGFNLFYRTTVLQLIPVLKEFVLMQVEPFVNEMECSTWQRASDMTVFDINHGFLTLINHMKVRWVVVVDIHVNQNSINLLISGIIIHFFDFAKVQK